MPRPDFKKLAQGVGAPPQPTARPNFKQLAGGLYQSPGVVDPLPGMAPVAAEAAATARAAPLEQTAAAIERRFPEADSPEKAAAAGKFKYAARRARGAIQGEAAVRAVAKEAGDAEALSELDAPTEPKPKVPFLTKFGTVLGGPARLGRNMLLAPLDEQTDFEPWDALTNDQSWNIAPGSRHSPERYMDRLEALKKEGGMEGAAAEALDFIPEQASANIARPVGAATAVALTEAAKSAIDIGSKLYERDPVGAADRLIDHFKSIPDQLQAMRDLYNDPAAAAQVKAVATDLFTDPTTYVGGSTKGGAQVAAKQAARIARALDLPEEAAAVLAKGLQEGAQLYGHEGMQMRVGRTAVETARAAGGGSIEARQILDATKKVVGRGGEHLGKGQLTVGIQPLNIQVEVADLLSKATGGAMKVPEQLTRKALEPIGARARALGRRMGGAIPEGNAHERLMQTSRVAEARRGAVSGAEDELQRFADEVASLAPADAARREEIVKQYIDPDFRQVSAVQAESIPGAVRHGDEWYAPVGPAVTPDFLSASEQQWVDALDAFFGRALDTMRKSGVDVGEAFNPISGKYIPRIFKKEGLPLRRVLRDPDLQHLEVVNPRKGPFSPMKPRTNKVGHPLGRGDPIGAKALYDPHEIVSQYVPKVERLKQKGMFDAWVADRFGSTTKPGTFDMGTVTALKNSNGVEVYVPNELAKGLEKAFESGFQGLAPGWLANVTSLFKEMQTIPVARYHIKNVMGDMLLMYAGGLRRPDFKAWRSIRFGKPMDPAFEIPGKGMVRVGEARALLKRAGIDVSVSATRDGGEVGGDILRGGMRGVRREMDKAARAGAKARGVPVKETVRQKGARIIRDHGRDAARDALGFGLPFGPAQRRVGAAVAREWDGGGKMLYFIDRLKKGDSPRRAAQQLYEVMPDYSDADRVLQAIRPFVPFATWQYRMAQNVPKLIARQPHSAMTTSRMADAFMGDDKTPQDPPPRYVEETAMSHPVGEMGRSVINRYLEARGADPLHPGLGLGVRIPDPMTDALVPVGEALTSLNPRPLAMMSHPALGTAWEWFAQQDALTGRPMRPPEIDRPFPTGMPGVPGEWQTGVDPEAGTQGNPWLTRAFPQMVMNPQVRLALNELLGGPYLGRSYARSPREDQRLALSELNLLTSLSPYTTDPAQALLDALDTAAVDKAQDFRPGRKKALRKAAQQ